MIGQTISHYKILSKLGEGGMGVVYKAEDLKLRRTVALKFLPPESTRDTDAKERFIHEAQAAATLNHPHICTIYEIDEHDGQSFIAMEFVEGESLKDRIQRGPLPIDEVISISVQIGEGLREAHQKGIIHRDIKSANVMLTVSGQVKVMDFGLAKLTGRTKVTREGTTLGTVGYMSPEQAQGEDADHRSDIWSLGVVLYEMVTGLLPFRGDYEQGLVYQIINSAPAPLTSVRTGVPMELERIVNKCLEKKRDERYQTAADLIADLRHLQRTLGAGTHVTEQSMATAGGVGSAPKGRRWPWAFPVIVIVAVAAVFLYFGKTHLSEPGDKPITSIAVLPFQNLAADPGQEYFSDGMTDAIIKELSQIKALRVISRTSVMRFKKTDKSMPEIARELGVDAVVEGSVLRADHDVRITAQLIAAHPEKHLWAEDFTRSLENILALQSEVAQAIAREIKVAVTPSEQERMAHVRAVNPEAHEAYLKGKYFLGKSGLPNWHKSIEFFQQAIDRDSTYALAYAGIAEAYDALGSAGAQPPLEAWPKVKAYTEKALALDPTLAEGILLIADLKLCYDWDVKGAEEYYKRTLELDPNLALARRWYGIFLASQGRMDEGIAELKHAVRLDPLSPLMTTSVARAYTHAGQYDSAFAYIRRAADIDSTDVSVLMTRTSLYLRQGRYADAIREAEKGISLGYLRPCLMDLAIAYALSGQTEKARETLSKLFEVIGDDYFPPLGVAAVYCALGDRERVFEYLEKAYRERATSLVVTPEWGPTWCDFVKSDPRYHEIMKKVGIEH